MIEGSIHQEVQLFNLHLSNNIFSKYTKLTLKELQGETDNLSYSEQS